MSDELADVFALVRAASSVERQIDRSVSEYHGVGLSDLRLLLELQDSPDGQLRRVELAERIGTTPSEAARRLGPLERIGLVRRESHPTDARLATVALTAAGDEMATNASATAQEAAERVLGPVLSAAQRETLRKLLRTLS
jgi:DNA-binding MarR family transcriptional regulator